jgi:mRNA interferase RelE/StbE
MASYKLLFKRSIEKDLKRIDKKEVSRLISAIELLVENPFPINSRKLVGSELTYRLRVGDYRVVYLVFMDKQEIEIARVRHRKDVYK